MQQVSVRTHPELNGLGVGQGGQPVHRHDAAKGAGAGIDRVLATADIAANQRADPVRSDHQVRLGRAAVGEFEPDAVALVDQVDKPVPEIEPGAAERAAEDALQVGTVDAVIGRAKALLVRKVVVHGESRNAPAIPPAAIDELAGLRRGGGDRVEDAEALQLPGRVGG
jgi:hypothetical protein